MTEPKNEFAQLKVRDLMTRKVISVNCDTSLADAVKTMVRHSIRHLPVLDGKKPVAVISDRDIRMMVTDMLEAEKRRAFLASTPVSKHASHPVTTAGEETTVRQAAEIFVTARIGCLPVVNEGGDIVGIITQTDLLKWLAKA